jgi:hypothetical protein
MVQPFNYVIPQADPFAGVLQGLKLGASMQELEAAREQRAAQTDALRQKLAMEQQVAQRAAANEAELQQLQAVPFEGMTRQQQLRLLQLTNSEASRAFIGRQLEQMPAAAMETRLRRSGSIVNALRMNPEIGIKLLRESSEAEQDPIQKKAYDDAASIAEKNPLLAARMIHGMMDFIGAGDEKAKRSADAVVNFLDRAGAPLYPKEPGKPMVVGQGASVYDPDTGTFKQAPVAPAKATPGEVEELVNRLQDPNLTPDARRAIQGRINILTTREAPAPREAKDDPRKVVAFRETDAAGNVTLLNKFGEVITPTAPVRGKPSATFEKTTAQRKQLSVDIDRTIIELTEVAKRGGLIDQSTGSGIGRAIDVGAGFVGQATPGAIAIGRLQPIADMVLKMVPRFEGPQSDKDTRSYKEAAGQLADATLPNEIRKQAALEIVRLMKARKGQFVTESMAAEGVGAAPSPTPAPAGGGAVSVTLPDGRTVSFPNQAAADQFKRAAGL